MLTVSGCSSDEAFSTSLRLRLGLEQLPAGYTCNTHNVPIDTFAHHELSCQNFQGAVHARDDLIRDELFAVCLVLDRGCELQQETGATSSAAISLSNMEAPKIEQRASARTVPGDIAVRLTRDANARTFYDITVVNTLTAAAEVSIGQAANPTKRLISFLGVAHRKKIEKHGADVARVGGQFFPLVVSTTGVWHPDSLTRLRELARYASTRQGISESESWKALLARLGCALAKGNELVLRAARRQMQPGADVK